MKKITNIDLIEILDNGCVQVRAKTFIVDEGQEFGGKFHRHVIAPGDDYSAEDARVQAVCAAVHTPEVIAAYQAAQEASRVEAVSEAG